MHSLYPALKPYKEQHLAVDNTHSIYIEECGNPQGLPVLFLHGGPGLGCGPDSRRFFDPELYRIVLFDQRGSGRSSPHGSLENNTTLDLVEDIEKIRQHLNISAWVVFGGSWGSTLALVYAETYPQRVLELILRGIFLVRPEDINWFYTPGGASRIFPDYWQDFIKVLNHHEQQDIIASFYKKLTSTDEVTQLQAAQAWSVWEGRTATLQTNQALVTTFSTPHIALSLARIECHYFINQSFLAPNQILQNAHKIAAIPGTIVHGRYDIICPLDNAYLLHQAWPISELQIIDAAGHSAFEPGITDVLIKATIAAYKRHS